MGKRSAELLMQQLPLEALQDLVGEARLRGVMSVLNEGSRVGHEREILATLVVHLYGDQLLEDGRVRAEILSLLPSADLEALAASLAGRSFQKPADNVLALVALPWRVGASLALEIARRFDLDASFLPRVVAAAPVLTMIRPRPTRPALRDYQSEVRDRVIDLVSTGGERILVQMPTGAGKTRTVMDTLVELAVREGLFSAGRSVLWLAHVEELCEQAAEAFEESWASNGDESVALVRAWGTAKPNVVDYQGAFIVGSYQKFVALRRQLEFDQIKAPLRIVVADEAHKVLAPTFASLLDDLIHADVIFIGLTATPGRGLQLGPENARLASFFHKNLIGPTWDENPIQALRTKGILARIHHKTIESSDTVTLTMAEKTAAADVDLPGTVLKRLAESPERNRRIIGAIKEEVAAGRPTLVFACSVEHARVLSAVLNLEGVTAAHVDASLSKQHRRDAIARFRAGEIAVLLNFGVLSTGFDVPRVSAVVIARPTTSVVLYSQMIGRGLRGPASGGAAECTLIDVRDNFQSFGHVDQVYETFRPYWE